ncbi:DUF2802 domain-containing protein [Alishewanella tabrizica]|uniref:DNA repair ATPase n=1 Tax=Alishewanella tabrizica TaxID=671278 RepID=A0ABQ2WNU7_9ALTE|nr:DUF2802 domain-containing protein [Alishewanella tabrizica]GGW63022.1 DNA repair ATPase [Alishewanella tabrizica]
MQNSSEFVWLAIAAVFLLGVLLLVWCTIQWRSNKQQLALLSQQLETSQQQWGIAQAEIEELRAGVIGVGQRVLVLQERQQALAAELEQLDVQQQAIALSDPESKIYSRAMKMVELGADLEEIIRECELPRAEAELLFNLHQQKSR